MKKLREITEKKPWLNWIFFLITVSAVFMLGWFASTIMERKAESQLYFQQAKPIADWEPRNDVWGQNFPREYETFMSTLDTSFKSKYGGSATRDYLEDAPELCVLWSGYAFSKDYKQARGHGHAIEDIRATLRTAQPQPGTCWSCKSPDVPRLINKMGAEKFYSTKWKDLGKEVVNSIGCQDCHDPKTMNLKITRPALVEAYRRQGKDINKATHQEMRSLVCAQCHVEYYFKGEGKYLTYPWDKGMDVDSMEKYYDEVNHVDFVHGMSKTPILKAQHPDYELFTMGVHADRNVACADCHMPYKREGAVKFSDHKIQSPLNNISGSCAVCHRESEEKLRNNVYQRQDKIAQLLKTAQQQLMIAHLLAKGAWDCGATENEMKPILTLIRHSQWRWDFVAASNGMGFHAPLEAARILAGSIQRSMEARILLTEILLKKVCKFPNISPDIATKAKAQEFIGLDMKKIQADKDEFNKKVLPEWVKNSPVVKK
ncbi:MAG: ammonia-forming cytochrome c nitrite reductase [Bacteroidota bacterium]